MTGKARGGRAVVVLTAALWATFAQAQVASVPLPRPAQAAIDDARSTIMVDPRLSLQKGAAIERAAHRLKDVRAREFMKASALWVQGESLLRVDKLDEAWKAIEGAKSIVLRVAPQSKLAGDILLSSGGAHASKVAVADALRDYQAAYRIYQAIGDDRSGCLALIYIANLYDDGQDHETALKYFEQALEVFEEDPKLVASIYNNQAINLQALGRNSEAAERFIKARTLVARFNMPAAESSLLRNIVRAQLAVGNLPAAEQTAREAMVIAAKAGGQEEPAMLGTLAELAFQNGRYGRAQALIDQSFAGVDLKTTTMPMRESHATAYRIYNAVGDAPRALAHLEAMKRLDDEATKLATRTSTALMGARFDFANQELRIAQLKAEELRRSIQLEQERTRSQQTIFLGIAGAALAVLAGLSIALFTIRRSRDAVRAANADLAVTNDALGEALAAKTEFLATTSHEIRTPLNGILGMAEVMLIDQTLPEAARERVRLVHGAGTTMRALIDDILDAAKIEKGKLSLEEAPFDLEQVVLDAASLWGDQIRGRGVDFAVAIDLPPGRVVGDASRVRQIVFNLLSNAAKFTETGAIRLEARLEGERYRIAVSDTGIGIPENKMGEIFESFRQADASTTRRFGGTGLGLSISRNLAKAMSGDLTATSAEGTGSVFTLLVALPRHIEEKIVGADHQPGNALLIVDRNPIMRAMFRSLLAAHRPHVVQAGSMDEALAMIEAHGPSDVLIDDGVAEGELDRLAMIAGACGASVTLLRSAGRDDLRVPQTFRVVEKPIAGPALIDAMFSPDYPEDHTSTLVSRAA